MDISRANAAMFRVVGRAFVFIGVLITILGVIWVATTASFLSRAARAPGVVSEMERSTSSEGGAVFYPVFTFTDGAGTAQTQRSSYGSSTYKLQSGDAVTVLYDPSDPEHARIDSFQTLWLGPLAITGFGLLFGGFACFWLSFATRAVKQMQDRGGAEPVTEADADHPRHYLDDVPTELQDLLYEGRKIQAIKLAREKMGWGLREAKERVEVVQARLQEGPPNSPPG